MELTEDEEKRLRAEYELKETQVLNCMFASWYPNYSSHTFKSRVVPLHDEFVEYLQDEGTIYLPSSAYKERKREMVDYSVDEWAEDDPALQRRRAAAAKLKQIHEIGTQSESDSESSEEEEEEEEPKYVEFPELEEEVERAIRELDGAVVPKLNWSSPKDASWMSVGGTLNCSSFADICLLLKSSDFVSHDLSYAFSESVDEKGRPSQLKRPPQFTLVLRKWFALSPALEFRCFVKRRTLVGISQRDPAKFYPFLPRMKAELLELIEDFFDAHILSSFPDENVVVDVYVEEAKKRVWLMDFNPFGPVTDGMLFSWAEIYTAPTPTATTTTQQRPRPAMEAENESKTTKEEGSKTATTVVDVDVDIRIVESEAEVRVSTANSSRFPVDVARGMFDAATATDINKLVEMMQSQGKLASM